MLPIIQLQNCYHPVCFPKILCTMQQQQQRQEQQQQQHITLFLSYNLVSYYEECYSV
jgi:hypothetical protein